MKFPEKELNELMIKWNVFMLVALKTIIFQCSLEERKSKERAFVMAFIIMCKQHSASRWFLSHRSQEKHLLFLDLLPLGEMAKRQMPKPSELCKENLDGQ